ncbi:HigA family addiction module antitoxin [Stenotrophomonas sp. YAU14D1_LEIMI4_1]|uniref:HigA family addiction module antitoxin n=1 Tax=Stenotrophomonas sp. YAU14D1_LEIMI4_1 TaxID=2072407 RepID=UPI000D541AB2|nr:HigA family addiction module antitoxin [Stenotrophomonas sp. YAU14D1_LEIMI4_1]AWH26419.1 addiction module antidote protein, HigA family [Stenotrophomonas sp. YAU14D1_LEIMI4_1]
MPLHDPPHPGEALREDILPTIKMSISALAHHLGYSRGQLSTVINGHAGISAELAYRLELAGLGNARMWLAMQAAYDLWQAEHREHPAIARLDLPEALNRQQ